MNVTSIPGSNASQQLIVQMSGAPGSGKSSTAKWLAQRINAVVVDLDTIRSCLLEDGVSSQQAGKLSYNLLFTMANDFVSQRKNVIIDSVCNYGEVIHRGQMLAQEKKCNYVQIECQVNDVDIIDARLKSRTPLRSQRRGVHCPPPDVKDGGDLNANIEKWFGPPHCVDGNLVMVNTVDRSLEGAGQHILERLEEFGVWGKPSVDATVQ